MRVHTFSIFAVFCIAIFQSLATAELIELEKLSNLKPLEKPVPFSIGSTSKVLKNGKPFESTVISSTSDTTEWKSKDGCVQKNSNEIFTMCIQWNNCPWGTGSSSNKLKGESWPLTLGKKWKYKINGNGWATTRSCKVKGALKVSTSLGEFDTYKVECKDTWNNEIWYVDISSGNVVYQTYKNSYHKIDDVFETIQFAR